MAITTGPLPTLPVEDLDRASRFYEGILGFSPASEQLEEGKLYDVAGTQVFLYPSETVGTAQNTQVAWFVDDIEEEVARLEKDGVGFENFEAPNMTWDGHIATTGSIRSAWFKDTEGNILCVNQKT